MIISRLGWLSFVLTLSLIHFQNSLAAGTFTTQWKRANIAPIHKKYDKQMVSNYRQVSPLPICNKMFEKLIFIELFRFFEDKNLLSKHQSGFHPGDSCIYQLHGITNYAFPSFGCNPSLETRNVFLDRLIGSGKKKVLVEIYFNKLQAFWLVDFKDYTQWSNIRLGNYSRKCTTEFNFRIIMFPYIY